MPVCPTCGIGYVETEIHACQGRLVRRPFDSRVFLARLRIAAIPSGALLVSLGVLSLAGATGGRGDDLFYSSVETNATRHS